MNRKEDYLKLAAYLRNCQLDKVTLTFTQIECIIEKELPRSAFDHKSAWWEKDRNHTQCVWLDAGYTVDNVNIEKEFVVFVKQ